MKRITPILLIFCLMITGCGAKEETVQEETIKKVYTQTVGASKYSDGFTVSGNVTPTEVVKLSFKLPGVISNVFVDEGDKVTQGQVVATMDQSDYSLKVKAAQSEYDAAKLQIETEIPAKLSQAQAAYDLTKVTYDRLKVLYEQEAIPKAKFDEISTKLKVDENTLKQAKEARNITETKLKMAEAALEAANSNINDTTIHSPINGVVLKKIFESGEVTNAGYPVVAIGKVDKVWVEIGVPDQHINSLKKGQKVNVYGYGINKSMEGTIDKITSLANEKTRTFPVKILVDNANGELKPGMIVKVDLGLNQSDKVIIPLSSVINLAEGSAVYVYSDETKTVSKRIIKTGIILNDKIEVTKGLKNGEKLVVEGQFVVKDGEKVTAKEMAK